MISTLVSNIQVNHLKVSYLSLADGVRGMSRWLGMLSIIENITSSQVVMRFDNFLSLSVLPGVSVRSVLLVLSPVEYFYSAT